MKQILLVEDTLHLAEEIADALRLEGYLVSRSGSALHALTILSRFTPDLIITDLLMPVMNGFELIQHIRSTASLKSIPIIILSAKTSPADKMRGAEVGANAFIQKPCKIHELVASITSLIK